MMLVMLKKEAGAGGHSPPTCKPFRTLELVDEDSLFDMRRVHEQKERRGWGEVAVVDEDSLFDVTQVMFV